MGNKKSFFRTIMAKSELSASFLLIMLLLTDIAFIILHILCKSACKTEWDFSFYNIAIERGAAEFFMYIKYFWIITLFVIIITYTKCYSYLSWVVTFIYLFVNDSLQINERLGYKVSDSFNFVPPLNLTADFTAELMFLAIGIIILFLIIALSYKLGSSQFRKVSLDISLILVVLIVFELLFVLLQGIINKQGVGLGLIEEGGKLIIISLLLWYVFHQAVNKGESDLSLCGLLKKNSDKISD